MSIFLNIKTDCFKEITECKLEIRVLDQLSSLWYDAYLKFNRENPSSGKEAQFRQMVAMEMVDRLDIEGRALKDRLSHAEETRELLDRAERGDDEARRKIHQMFSIETLTGIDQKPPDNSRGEPRTH